MLRSGAKAGGPGLDAEARAWLNERELGEVVRVLGEVGSSLADLAMLTAEDVEALNLKVTLAASRHVCCVPSDLSVRFWQTLTRRRLRGNLCSLPNSQCSAVPSAALEGCASRPPAPLFHARDVESVVLKISRNTLKDWTTLTMFWRLTGSS